MVCFVRGWSVGGFVCLVNFVVECLVLVVDFSYFPTGCWL